MSNAAVSIARALNIDPESFPLEEEDLDNYMALVVRPYGVEVPRSYEDLLKIIDSIIHLNIRDEHYTYFRVLPPALRRNIGIWQSFSASHVHHNIRLYMEDPISWKQKVQALSLKVEDEAKLLHYIEAINTIINGAPPLSEPITVYRRVTRNPELSYVSSGGDYINRSFTSTTTWYQVAQSYEGKRGRVIKIHLPTGTKGFYLGGVEHEILLPANSYFRYEGSTPMPTYTLVQ